MTEIEPGCGDLIMKQLVLLLLIIMNLTLGTQSAFAEDDDTLELQQAELSQVTTTENSGDLMIKASDKLVYEIEAVPNFEHMKQALGLIIPDNVRERILLHGGTITDVNPMAGYEGLSAEKKEHFQKTRMMFLSNVARALNATKFVFGAGSIVGDSFRFIKKSVKAAFGKKTDDSALSKEKIGFSERSQRAVQATLQALDYKLWNQAPLLLDSNEFGVSASLGIMVENGILSSGVGGSEELGLSFAYNKTNKAFVFEIYHNSEKYSYTPAIVTAVGVLMKAGPQFGNRDLNNPTRAMTGVSFYPPSMPGYSSTGADYFSAGFSSSIGFPPNPIVDMLTYTNKYQRNSIIRITISPVMTGYVRMYIGNIPGSIKIVLMRVVGIFQFVSEKAQQILIRRNSCQAIFSH